SHADDAVDIELATGIGPADADEAVFLDDESAGSNSRRINLKLAKAAKRGDCAALRIGLHPQPFIRWVYNVQFELRRRGAYAHARICVSTVDAVDAAEDKAIALSHFGIGTDGSGVGDATSSVRCVTYEGILVFCVV